MALTKNDIPTWALCVMLASSLVGLYFLIRDLIGRIK